MDERGFLGRFLGVDLATGGEDGGVDPRDGVDVVEEGLDVLLSRSVIKITLLTCHINVLHQHSVILT